MGKTNHKTKLIAFLLAFTLAVLQIPVTAWAASIRPADVEKADSGNLLVGVSGSFERVSKDKILKRINKIRKEACDKGYINPATGKKLKSSDYVEMKWSSDLEWIAQLRAAEAAVNESHTRPNGKSCFSISYNGAQSWAENLAWNYSGLMQGIEQWYGEKGDWVKQNKNAVTGHYTSLINPNYQCIGLGSFVRSTGGWHAVSAEFGYSASGSQKQSNVKGKVIQ
ncbi:MAG: CAP domain-containing protein, partial [Lachnospiraceae bacterium]|nr:CAP domain-containing protein [Lachnospiraceae bacterium]